jgi:hypothetical protein
MSQRPNHPDTRQQLIAAAHRRAFETYLRFGRMPDSVSDGAERKAINSSQAIPAGPTARATRYYVWRTAGDDRVRHSHATRHGQVFAWSEPPPGGHPGTEANCRCRALPYYGDPSVRDALQPLHHDYQVDAAGRQDWASIEMLTRADGSMVQSVVVGRDGTRIRSKFAGTLVARRIELASGQTVRVDTEGGVQSVYIGNAGRPLFQSTWAANGPKIIRARQSVAFLGDADTLVVREIGSDPPQSEPQSGVITLLPNLSGLLTLAFVALYAAQRSVPASQGLVQDDEPIIVLRTWDVARGTPVPIHVDTQSDEIFRRSCQHREAVEMWALEAIAKADNVQEVTSAQTFGIRAHKILKDKVDAMRKNVSEIYGNLSAEISFVDYHEQSVPYGTKGSSRLDILEDRRKDMGAICVYDMKTGATGLTAARLTRIGKLVAKVFRDTTLFYVIQIGPTNIGGFGR